MSRNLSFCESEPRADRTEEVITSSVSKAWPVSDDTVSGTLTCLRFLQASWVRARVAHYAMARIAFRTDE